MKEPNLYDHNGNPPPSDSEPCTSCTEMDYLASFCFGADGALDIRFDPDNAEIDIIYLSRDIDRSIQINFCPFCGRKLRKGHE